MNSSMLTIIVVVLTFAFHSCSLLKIEHAREKVPKEQKKEIEDKTPEETIEEVEEIVTLTIDSLIIKKKQDSISKIYPLTKKDRYKIAYLLPLNLDEVLSPDYQQGLLSKYAQDFYMGSKLALEESISAEGLNLEVFIYDTYPGDENSLNNVLSKIEENDIDIIIGPLLSSKMDIFSEYSLKTKTPLYSPTANNKEYMSDNPYFVSGRPTIQSIADYLGKFIHHYFSDYNLILICEDKETLEEYTAGILRQGDTSVFSGFTPLVVNKSNWGSAPYTKYLQAEKNVVFSPISSPVVINSLLSYLMRNIELDITIIAPYDWLGQAALEIYMLEHLQTRLYSEPLLDYKDSVSIEFVETYRQKYKTEASNYSHIGFKTTVMIADLISEHGRYFQRGFMTDTDEEAPYPFYKITDNNKSFESTDIWIFESIDFEIRRLKTILDFD